MAKYVFKNYKEFEEFYNSKCSTKSLGFGGEGECRLGNDGYAYKKYDEGVYKNPNCMVLDDDIKLDSYVFPIDIFVVNNNVVGYKTKYIKDDIFLKDKKWDEVLYVNTDNMPKAYLKILKDTILLSKKKVLIDDLAGNLMYDNKDFYAIDTSMYKYVDESYKDLLIENIDSLIYALKSTLLYMHFNIDDEDNYKDFKKMVTKLEAYTNGIKSSIGSKNKRI